MSQGGQGAHQQHGHGQYDALDDEEDVDPRWGRGASSTHRFESARFQHFNLKKEKRDFNLNLVFCSLRPPAPWSLTAAQTALIQLREVGMHNRGL